MEGRPPRPFRLWTTFAGSGGLQVDIGHTEWVDGRAHQTGITSVFSPNTQVPCDRNGITYDVDYTSYREGKSSTEVTYAAVTARSYHNGGVTVSLMDGSVRFMSDAVDLSVWRAASTRRGGEPASVDD